MMASTLREAQASTDPSIPHRKENLPMNGRPQSTDEERAMYLQRTGECQAFLEQVVEQDESLSSEQRDEMEASMTPLLTSGFFLMTRKVLSPQEYYQGCTAVLLGRLLELGGLRPSSVIAAVRTCLGPGKSNDNNDGDDSRSSLISLALVHSHPGLKLDDWGHVLGLVSTIQSSVAVLHKRQEQLKKDGKKNGYHSLNTVGLQSMEAMWVIPMSYIVGYVVFQSHCSSTQEEEGSNFSWKRDIGPKIEEILYKAFPQLRPREYIDAGLVLLKLDLLQQDEAAASVVDVVTTSMVVEELEQQSVCRLLEKITDLPRYTFLARCANIFLGRLDTDSTDDVVDACSRLLQKESPSEYLRQLGRARNSFLANETNLPLLTNGNSNGKLAGNNELRSLGYPVLIHIDALLVSGFVDLAIDIAVKMEKCPALSERDQTEAWSKIFHYLTQTGQVFLDGFPLNREDYLMNRKIIIEKIVSASCLLAIDVFIDGYIRILEEVAKLTGISEEERLYVQRACHQTVLRVFQAKYNEQQGIEMFHRIYWKGLDETVSGATSRWSSLSLSSSKQEQRKWAFELLTTENEIPQSLRLENTNRPDLDVLVRRASGSAMSLHTMQLESEKSAERLLLTAGTETHESPTAARQSQSPTAASTGDMDVETEAMDEEGFSGAQEKQSEDDGVDSANHEEHESEAAEVDDEDDESDEEDDNEAHAEDGAMDRDRMEANEVEEIVIEDSSDDDEAEANIAEIVNSEEDGNESDATADEEGISELFDKGDEAKESDGEAVEADDDSEDSHDEDGSEAEVVDVDMSDDHEEEEEEEQEEIINDDNVDEEAMEKESDVRSHSSAEAGPIEGAANQSMDEAGSQTGYEPECVYTEQSEEEVSEAMHTEDEEEERESLMKRAADQISESKEVAPAAVKPLAALEAHSLSDMDYADEHTTEHEEDLGAESSELDEGEGTDAPPSYPEPFSGAGRGTTLTDFAKMAQRQVDQEPAHSPQVDATTTSLSTPWHWGQQSSPQKQGPGLDPPDAEELQQEYASGAPVEAAANSIASDTNAAHMGAASVNFLDECSLNASECDVADIADAASPSKVVIEQVPKELQDSVAYPGSPPAAQKSQDNKEDEAASEASAPLEQGDEHEQPNAEQETTGSLLLQQSVVGASIADTSAARFGSVSFVNSPGYAPTEDEDEAAQKILVDKLPAAFEQVEETPAHAATPVAAGDESKDESRSSALPDQKSAPEHTSPDPPGEKDDAILEDSDALGPRQETSLNVVKEKDEGVVEGIPREPEGEQEKMPALPCSSKVGPPKDDDDASGDDAVESPQKVLVEENIGAGLGSIDEAEKEQEDIPASSPKRGAEPSIEENDGAKSPADDESKHKAAKEQVIDMNPDEDEEEAGNSEDEANPTKEVVGGYGDMEEEADDHGEDGHGEDRDNEMKAPAEKSVDELKKAESGEDEATDVSSRPPPVPPVAPPEELNSTEGKLDEEGENAEKEDIETAPARDVEALNQGTPKSEQSGRSSLDENITLSELGTRASGQNPPPAVAAAPSGSPASPNIQANKGNLSRASTLDSNSSFNISSVNVLIGSPGVSSVATSALGGSPGRPAPKIPFAVREASDDADSTDDEEHAKEKPTAPQSSKRQRAQGEEEEGDQSLPSKKAKQGSMEGGASVDSMDYSTMTNNDLKKLLRKRKLPVTGNKAVLTGRLRAADKEKDGAGSKSKNDTSADGDNDGPHSRGSDAEDEAAADEKPTQSQSMRHSIEQTARKPEDEREPSPARKAHTDDDSIDKEDHQEGKDVDQMEEDESPEADNMKAEEEPGSPAASKTSKLSSKQPTSAAPSTTGRELKKQEEVGGADENEKQAEETTTDVAFSSMKAKELQELLRKKGLPISGNKTVLISRLEKAAEGNKDAGAAKDNDGTSSKSGDDEGEAVKAEDEKDVVEEPESPAASKSSRCSSKQPTSAARSTTGRGPKKQEEVGGTDEKNKQAEETTTAVDYSSMKVKELRDLLQEKNLSIDGNKKVLISRLEKAAEGKDDASAAKDNDGTSSKSGDDEGEAVKAEDEKDVVEEPESPAASRSSRRSSKQPTSAARSTTGRGSKKQQEVGGTDEEDKQVEETTTAVDYSSMKVKELRDLLQEKNLSIDGNKKVLISRLEKAAEGKDDASAAEDNKGAESDDAEDDTGDEADNVKDKNTATQELESPAASRSSRRSGKHPTSVGSSTKGRGRKKEEDVADSDQKGKPLEKASGVDYSSMTQKELRQLLKERSLPVGGSKADLAARLQNDDAGAMGDNDDDKSVASNASDGSRRSRKSRARASSNADEEDAASASTEGTGRSKRSRKKASVGAEESESEDESTSATKSTASSSRKKRKTAVKSTKAVELPPIPEEAEASPRTASPGKGRKKRTTRKNAAGDTDDDASTAAGSTTSSVRRSRRAKKT